MIREIVTLMEGQDIVQKNRALLRTPCLNVDEITEDVLRVAQDLSDTIVAIGGLGLAANQIGETYRMFAMFDETVEDPVVLINPVFIPEEQGGKEARPEGCFSLPGSTAVVERWRYGQLLAMTIEGEERTYQLPYHVARIAQHEIDHLDGVLMTDRALSLQPSPSPNVEVWA